MSWWNYRPYVSVGERKRQAQETISKEKKRGQKLNPVEINGRVISKTFWGKSWCDHLESFGDYENRLPRGRSYVRSGSVIHLEIASGKIHALVQGSSLYKVTININPLNDVKWKSISKKCSQEIESVIELLQGKLSSSVMKAITDQREGLFPLPKEIKLECSCPDWAEMCKHVAAVLYGVGARLDLEPELLFKLRQVDHTELLSKTGLKPNTQSAIKPAALAGQNLSELFNIDLDDGETPAGNSKVPAQNGSTKKMSSVRPAVKNLKSKNVLGNKKKRNGKKKKTRRLSAKKT